MTTITHNSTVNTGAQQTCITITPPLNPGDATSRLPIDTVLVIDTSYSMKDEVSTITETGGTVSDGLSILDLVKHASKTIVRSCNRDDILSVVAYSTEGSVIVRRMMCSDDNKVAIIAAIDGLRENGQTNIWGGLHKALETVYEDERRDELYRHKSILLLTDGRPNINPPRGVVGMLQFKQKQRQSSVLDSDNVSINTFGFGYNLDSDLLRSIAEFGNGMYGFIPDASFVGTIFTNTFANELSTVGRSLKLCIVLDDSCDGGFEDIEVVGGYKINRTLHDKRGLIDLGFMRYGQPRNIVLRVPLDKTERLQFRAFNCSYTDIGTDAYCSTLNEVPVANSDDPDIINVINTHYYRSLLVEELNKQTSVEHGHTSEWSFPPFKDYLMNELKKNKTAYSTALQTELEGQISEAMSVKYKKKWGIHYIRSILMAHRKEETINFKDPAMQLYAGTMFEHIRDRCEDIFIKSPPPTPSRRVYNAAGCPRPAPRVVMANYMNAGAGCISGSSLVSMTDNYLKYVKDVKKGDMVKCPDSINGLATIKFVLRYPVPKTYQVVKFRNGLTISPYHPIIHNADWQYPCKIKTPENLNEDYVYNFVLEGGSVLIVNRESVITLGHNFTTNAVVKHDYLGTSKVLEDIEAANKIQGDTDYVVITEVMRDEHTGQICKMR
jgi:hypothetical protein